MYYNQFGQSDDIYNYNNLQQSIISIQDAIQIALNQVYGQVIKAELDTENSRLVYEVEVLTPQDIIFKIEVDAITGYIVNVEME